jgi:formate dehydrogenase subunit gamma
MKKEYQRHNGWDIAIHWFNTVLWLLLFFTGIALIKNEFMAPFGQWYPDAVRSLFGGGAVGGARLLVFHEVIGAIWVLGFVAYMLVNWRGAKYFLKESFKLDMPRDLVWMMKKPFEMMLGKKGMQKVGMKPSMPPQGFYNMGQKAFAQVAVISGIGLAVTGLFMVLSQTVFPQSLTWIVQWSILLHFVFAALTFVGLLVHVYMAVVAKEERPAFRSMFTGTVPEEYAKHHHQLWYEEVRREEELKN